MYRRFRFDNYAKFIIDENAKPYHSIESKNNDFK